MIRLLLILLGLVGFSGYVASDDHQPSSVVVEVYECTLNDGASAEDLADFGGTDFKKFVNKNKLVLNSYLWDAVAVSPPFDEPDVRWVNYYFFFIPLIVKSMFFSNSKYNFYKNKFFIFSFLVNMVIFLSISNSIY